MVYPYKSIKSSLFAYKEYGVSEQINKIIIFAHKNMVYPNKSIKLALFWNCFTFYAILVNKSQAIKDP